MEYIDDPLFNVQTKQKIIQGLHLKNNIFGTYNKTIKILGPFIAQINKDEKRPARILEIGSGTGNLSMALYKKTKNTSVQIELTGSDIIPEYVNAANDEAIKRNFKIDFLVIDAFHLDQLEPNSYDIIFTLHSMHHFLPEQLAMIMSGSQKVATKAFIGIDGYRGFGNLLFMMISGIGASIYNLDLSFFHDALISGRKMYGSKQLEIIAKIGCPQSTVVSKNLKPGLSVIQILTNKR
jgi:SAM-dependent methyltransferase